MNPYHYQAVLPSIITELTRICGPENVTTGKAQGLRKYSHDQVAGDQYAHMPEVVVQPETTQQVSAIVKLSNREHIPITPRGAGSGLSGGAVPVYGGIVLSLERMNRILEIDAANLMAVVEPGVVTNRLDQALQDYGLFFAGYPMSEAFCFVGGNVAENAGGVGPSNTGSRDVTFTVWRWSPQSGISSSSAGNASRMSPATICSIS